MSVRTHAVGWVSSQGHYAGSVSRFLAFVVDAAVSAGLFALGLAATSLVVQVVTGHSVSWSRTNIVVAIIFVVWEFFYFGYSWAASGRSFGMAVLGVRVVRADGTPLEPRQGVVRALVFPLSFLFCGLGFLGIIVQREHRALHDLIAGTAVIYSWDARAARLRFLAREAEVGGVGSSQRESDREGGGDDGTAT
ncbi:MAG: RDD family protein [Streptosporangiaceae bacterium]